MDRNDRGTISFDHMRCGSGGGEDAGDGDSVTFGWYEQDGNTENGPEAIEWQVLDTDGQKVMLLSRYCLELMPFLEEEGTGNRLWRDSLVRAWLNGEFLNTAFSAEEQMVIAKTDLPMDTSENVLPYGIYVPGDEEKKAEAESEDQVFLLSFSEAEKYLGFGGGCIAKPTPAIAAKGTFTLSKTDEDIQMIFDTDADSFTKHYLPEDWDYPVEWMGSCYWRLRSVNMTDFCAACIYPNGYCPECAYAMYTIYPYYPLPVRPALWVDLSIVPDAVRISDKVEEPDPAAVKKEDGIITFGRYEQDGNLSNGPEPIAWRILQTEEDKALLISCYGLDAVPYEEATAYYNIADEFDDSWVNWEISTLLGWLNGDFRETAFTDEEQKAIQITVTYAPKEEEEDWEEWEEDSEEETADEENEAEDLQWEVENQLFILDEEEAETLFDSPKDRTAKPTAYAICQGAYRLSAYGREKLGYGEETEGNGLWWLRKDELTDMYVGVVDITGEIAAESRDPTEDMIMVRPAVWVSLPLIDSLHR